jgi:DNA-binding winged helix-turn-helix (wHTH) protein/Tfp pilus assembly protein PilF
MALANQGSYNFGEFQLNLDLRVLARRGERVPLGSKAYEILTCLVLRAGEVVTKSELFAAVWAESFVEEGALSQQIFSLRKALGDKADYIVTVPGQGYRFMGAVQHVASNAAPGAHHGFESLVQETRERTHMVIEEPMLPQAAARPRITWRTVAPAVAIVAIVAIGTAALRVRHRSVPPEDFIGVVMSDVTNTTGDAGFDLTMKRAIEIELSQSPFLGVLSASEAVNTLKLMGKNPDTPMTPAVAREVCERTNRQVLLTGSIASLAQQYLVTMDATSCLTGQRVASVKAEAHDKGEVLAAVDRVGGEMRAKLGESAGSLQRYDVPLKEAATSSLEALRAYSMAQNLDAQGAAQLTVLPLYQKAVELDPQFALAYEAMAGNYYELQEGRLASANYKKAFDLRDRVGESDRLGFEARYYAYGLGDAVAGLSAFRAWAGMYPHDYRPWVNIANFDNQLGNPTEAIAAGERAIQINPNYTRAYAVTGRAYKNASRFAEAKAVEAKVPSQASNPAGSNTTFEIAFYEHDHATFDRIVKEFEDTQWPLRNYYLGQARSMEGKYAEAKRILDLEIDEDRKLGKGENVDGVLVELATIARVYGYPAEAHAYLARISKGYLDSDDAAFEFAMSGDVTYAKRYLAAHEHDQHAPTDQAAIKIPRMRAVVAMREGEFAEALEALEPARPYDLAGFDTRILRAAIYSKMHQPGKAAEEYKNIVDGPGSGFGVSYPLAQLGLARAEAAAGNLAASRAAYQSFLDEWKDADPDVPLLKAAKLELAGLH